MVHRLNDKKVVGVFVRFRAPASSGVPTCGGVGRGLIQRGN
jgi:hypothetical protein